MLNGFGTVWEGVELLDVEAVVVFDALWAATFACVAPLHPAATIATTMERGQAGDRSRTGHAHLHLEDPADNAVGAGAKGEGLAVRSEPNGNEVEERAAVPRPDQAVRPVEQQGGLVVGHAGHGLPGIRATLDHGVTLAVRGDVTWSPVVPKQAAHAEGVDLVPLCVEVEDAPGRHHEPAVGVDRDEMKTVWFEAPEVHVVRR